MGEIEDEMIEVSGGKVGKLSKGERSLYSS